MELGCEYCQYPYFKKIYSLSDEPDGMGNYENISYKCEKCGILNKLVANGLTKYGMPKYKLERIKY